MLFFQTQPSHQLCLRQGAVARQLRHCVSLGHRNSLTARSVVRLFQAERSHEGSDPALQRPDIIYHKFDSTTI